MAANSSFSSNDSSPNSSSRSCFQILPYYIMIPTTFVTIFLFLLPLFIFILHHGLQQWRKKASSSSSSSAAMSHSDCFTYNMVLMELVGFIGHVIYFCRHLRNDDVVRLADYLIIFSYMGKMLLHLLTCVERCLAVVHPITYMRMRNRKGIRIRNISIVSVWMISGALTPLPLLYYISAIIIAAISFFSLSVLLVLVRPGPGEQGGNRQWADPSKKRAFFTIVAILGVLVLSLSGDLCFFIVYMSKGSVPCVFEVFLIWLELPKSLVLPLLFLLRHGRRNKQ